MSGVLGLWSFVCVVVWSGWVWSGLAWSGLVLALTSPFKPGGSPWQLGRRTLHVAHEELLGCWLLVLPLGKQKKKKAKLLQWLRFFLFSLFLFAASGFLLPYAIELHAASALQPAACRLPPATCHCAHSI